MDDRNSQKENFTNLLKKAATTDVVKSYKQARPASYIGKKTRPHKAEDILVKLTDTSPFGLSHT